MGADDTAWVCMACGSKAENPEIHARHLSACRKPKPKGWDHGWQGDTPPVAGQLNVHSEFGQNRTPPGQVLTAWLDWKPRR